MFRYILMMQRIKKFACIVILMLIVCYVMKINKKQQLKNLQRNNSGTKETTKFGIMTLQDALNVAKLKEKIIINWCHKRPHKLKQPCKDYCGWCTMSTNKSLITDPRTAAVIFHNNCMMVDKMPPDHLRRPDMYYIWFNRESPLMLSWRRKYFVAFENNYFNATMTYRRDSSIYAPYGPREVNRVISKFVPVKKRLGVWIVSNCDREFGAKKRIKYFKELLKSGLKVDTYGRCFNQRVSLKRGNEEFFRFVGDYKFYFAFENSFHCRDYVTEKFIQHGLYSGTIPIVWGPKKSDVEVIAPPHSFIHVEDFKSAADLANYISYLDKNNTAYMEYHEWRKHLQLTDPYARSTAGACRLCNILHGIEDGSEIEMRSYYVRYVNHSRRNVKVRRHIKHRVVKNLDAWWYGSDNHECLFE
ncbi:4-galactosyl-N-acetylglucosaminide 3-alpha-L-fucosyltransferase 9-like [Ciona intestinalis]